GFIPDYVVLPADEPTGGRKILERGAFGGRRWVLVERTPSRAHPQRALVPGHGLRFSARPDPSWGLPAGCDEDVGQWGGGVE
nr:hypothetical protein [Actinomycetota bacterium]